MNPGPSPSQGHTPEDIRTWLIAEVAARVGSEPRRINPAERFSRFGLDSMKAASVTSSLSTFLGRPLPRTLLWDNPSVDAVVRFLTAPAEAAEEATPSRPVRRDEAIAVVGLACRFPEAPDPAAFWRLLLDGVDAICEVPPERWELEKFFSEDRSAPGKMSTRWGGFLRDVDKFDPQFFGISPREAAQMDPQQRLFLELAWEAIEDAGIDPASLKGSATGVYVGALWSDYARLLAGTPTEITQHTATGQDTSIIAARVSYTFGLQGPSLAINTACSSSLVAVHTACQALRNGEATMALAGGVNLVLSPESTVAMSKFGGMAPDGRSKAFDARANGYVRSEGGGIVVLKPLSDALKAGDAIYAVILGEGINNDGFSNGLTAPNPQAQEQMLRLAYARAGVAAADVDYIETHGTGTLLGDPIEAGAIGRALGAGRDGASPLRLGSVKTNIGHLEAAAGIAGLIKVVLAIRHGIIPGNLHFESPNPNIDFDGLHLAVQAKTTPWPAPSKDRPAIAGVSSFGFGGTNCHVVLQDRPRGSRDLLPLSGDSDQALRETAESLRAFARGDGEGAPLASLCRAAAERSAGSHRAAITAASTAELAAQLDHFLGGGDAPGIASGVVPAGPPQLVWICSAHGGQWTGMGRQLLERDPAFRAALQRCSALIKKEAGWDLLDEVLADQAASRLGSMEIAQPAIFSIQVALAAVWRSWGLEPDVVIGHSMGEVAAAHIGGALTLEDAVKVICQRSRLLARTSGKGALGLIGLSADATAAAIQGRGRLWVVAYNSPSSTLVSGEPDVLAALLADLERDGVFCRKVRVDVAPHSPYVDPLLDELAAAVAPIVPRVGTARIYSTVTGRALDGNEFGPSYWVRNLRQPVLFAQAVDEVLRATDGPTTFVELGPHPVLAPALKQSLANGGRTGAVVETLRREEDERGCLLDAAGRLYVDGQKLLWDTVLSPCAPVSLPISIGGKAAEPPRAEARIFAISSHTRDALAERARSLAAYVRGSRQVPLRDICYTASARRSAQTHRLAAAVRTHDELADALDAAAAGDLRPGVSLGARELAGPGRIAFVFPGQGSQWLGMGRQLLEQEPVFRDAMRECDRAIRTVSGWSVIDELRAGPGEPRLDQIDIIQPALFAMQVALAALWRSWGVEPQAVVGHSMGEVAAAFVSGALSIDDAARIICCRSTLLRRISGQGLMAVVELSLEEAAESLAGYEDRLSVAVSNSASSTVLSGDPGALDEVMAALTSRGIFCRHVKVDVASHSPQVEPLRAHLVEQVGTITPVAGAIPVYSTVRGALTDGTDLGPEYWSQNLRKPVLFSTAVSQLLADGFDTFVEVSTHPLLVASIQESARGQRKTVTVVGSLRRDEDERCALLSSLGSLFAAGHDIAFDRLFPDGGSLASLPPYAWDRQRCWLDLDHAKADRAASEGAARSDALYYEVDWVADPAAGEAAQPRRWLVLSDEQGFGAAVAAELATAGHDATLLSRAVFENTDIDVAVARLADEYLGSAAPAWDAVVHMWSLDAQLAPGSTAAALESAIEVGTFAALRLVQRIEASSRKPRLYFVTAGAQPVAGDRVTAPHQATLWGLASSIAVEHPEFRCTRVDLDPSADTRPELVAAELARDGADDLVAFRNGERYVARLIPGVASLRAADVLAELARLAAGSRCEVKQAIGRAFGRNTGDFVVEPPALPDFGRGTCLVTGGLGGLGLAAAAWLVEHGARHVALVSRRAPSETARAAIARMEEAGAQVLTFSADVASEKDLARVLVQIEAALPPVRGIVHAAGVLDDAVLTTLDRAKYETVLAPKVRGAWLLHQLTRDRSIDFFVLYSSVLSYLGAAGQANHAIANAFLDALAHYRRGQGLAATSINWGVWSEVGSAATAGRGDRLAAQGLAGISVAEGAAALERLLTADAAQASVMRFDAASWRAHLPGAARSRFFSLVAAPVDEPSAGEREPELSLAERLRAVAAGPGRQELLERHLVQQVAQVLRMPVTQIDLNRPVRAMGLDSLMAVEFRNRLEADTGVSIPTTLVWNYPTIVRLAPEVAARMGIELTPASAAATGADNGDGAGDLEDLLGDLEALSDDAATRALAENGRRVADV